VTSPPNLANLSKIYILFHISSKSLTKDIRLSTPPRHLVGYISTTDMVCSKTTMVLFFASLIQSCTTSTPPYDDGVCTLCAENMYCSNDGIHPCPAFSNSSLGSTISTDCKCQLGYAGNGGECQECPVGSFKNIIGNSSCIICLNNTYSSTPASISCTSCPANTFSYGGKGISDCVGITTPPYDDGVCTLCAENMYCSNDGIHPCPAFSNSSLGSTISTDCKCQRGYEGVNGGECQECPSGTFKHLIGNSSCIFCPNNTYSSTPASISCTSCPANTFSYGGKGISDCVDITTVSMPTPVHTSTPTPAGTTTNTPTSNITFIVSIELGVEDFTTYIRAKFVEDLADMLDVERSSVSITSITAIPPTDTLRRRLLSASSAVTTLVVVPSEETESVVSSITYENLSAALVTSGLSVTAVSTPVIVVSTPTAAQINPTPQRILSRNEQKLIEWLGSCPCAV
jgi:hypothetical protein